MQFSNDCQKKSRDCDCYAYWLAQKSRASFPTNEKQTQNQSNFVGLIFPALWPSYRKLLGILIGSSVLLRLVGVITFWYWFFDGHLKTTLFRKAAYQSHLHKQTTGARKEAISLVYHQIFAEGNFLW